MEGALPDMKLIIGLGNPGEKYARTRHNLGFMVVEQLLKDYEPVGKTVWEDNTRLKSDVALFDWQRKNGVVERVVVAKPKTFMNNSGMAVSLLANYYKVTPDNIWIIYDDLDLPMGSMKIRFGGASGGHHGIDSVLQTLGTDTFWRFRLGIGLDRHSSMKGEEGGRTAVGRNKIKNAEDFVIGKFTGGQWGKARELIKRGSEALQMALEEDLERAMNRYNTK